MQRKLSPFFRAPRPWGVIAPMALSMTLSMTLSMLASLLGADAASANTDSPDSLRGQLGAQLVERYPGARIELKDFVFQGGTRGLIPGLARDVRILSESGKGTITFSADGVTGTAGFHAWMPALVPVRRIAPLQKIAREELLQRELDVAAGRWRDLRGIILSPESEIERLETRQTLLEGEAVLRTAVMQVPDVRRGDPVRVRLISGDIVLSTQGTAVESGYLDKSLRILTDRTKRELVGRLVSGRTVEVQL